MLDDVYFAADPYDMAEGCHALALITEWNEFKELDMARVRSTMQSPILFDGRNIYDPVEMARIGFRYLGMGRGVQLESGFSDFNLDASVPPAQVV